ncbi:hypothetical protein RHMOL_Rhmol01G0078500 [Rhododendron molle]|uniref:Uncharacterized protein n=1 Tax=Rhododendron molle TaxID=49168 RepID=A0ACC0PZP6_RHOML|nr:hypothetical protein RHMOL_Rhmol01G0078500 [Rhododendron molle]
MEQQEPGILVGLSLSKVTQETVMQIGRGLCPQYNVDKFNLNGSIFLLEIS